MRVQRNRSVGRIARAGGIARPTAVGRRIPGLEAVVRRARCRKAARTHVAAVGVKRHNEWIFIAVCTCWDRGTKRQINIVCLGLAVWGIDSTVGIITNSIHRWIIHSEMNHSRCQGRITVRYVNLIPLCRRTNKVDIRYFLAIVKSM